MRISNNTSPAFGSIQAGITKMDNYQKKVCDTFYRGIKYSEKYSKYTEEDIDIYVLPSKTADIEIRYMDPYSGKFFKDEEGWDIFYRTISAIKTVKYKFKKFVSLAGSIK